MFRSRYLLFALVLFASCEDKQKAPSFDGPWRGVLLPDSADPSIQLPFNFEIDAKNSAIKMYIKNADETIVVDEVSRKDDSLFIRLPVFDSEFRCLLLADSMSGVWINHARKEKNVLPFRASYNADYRFDPIYRFQASNVFNGKWEVEFSPGTADAYKAIGEFSKMDDIALKGTFLTETGDYRYLEGISKKNEMKLSCFDGAHAFLFQAEFQPDSTLKGHFWSGRHWQEDWTARRNDSFQLRNPDSLTYLKPGYDKINFKFKNLEGKEVSLSDEKFKGKVVIVQITGSWCPNCMDESMFFGAIYREYKGQGLEIVALSFERTDNFDKAVFNVKRMKDRLHADYEFLITMKTGKEGASEALPMLNNIMSFPTTIFIDKKGKVRKIYTGFNGPATGEPYTKYTRETESFINRLLEE